MLMIKFKSTLQILLLSFLTISTTYAETVKTLFLGHKGEHHNSGVNHYKLIPEFLRRGIAMNYTENLGDLNVDNLKKYDALIIYANYDKLNENQEKALLDFVESGKGFIPLHCASACFGKSTKYVSLVGGRFKKHSKGWFTCKHATEQGNHPALSNVRNRR
jgi:uncharacterized protein